MGRLAEAVGDATRLLDLHGALASGGTHLIEGTLSRILMGSASYYDLEDESSYHMLVLGLCFGMPGYHDPISNRESGTGRFDVRVDPEAVTAPFALEGLPAGTPLPLVTIEVKWEHAAGDERLQALAVEGLQPLVKNSYDHDAPSAPSVRWGLAFCGKRVAVACERK